MMVKLIKKQVSYKNKSGNLVSAYNFSLQLESGATISIMPTSWVDKNGNRGSTYKELVLIAEEVKEGNN